VLAIGLVIAFGSWGTIDAGNVGVVLHMGATTGEMKQPGFYTKMPWAVHVVEMNVQIQKEQVETEAASRDLQTVQATIALNLSLNPSSAATIYQDVGIGYMDKIVAPAMQESIKSVIAQYTAEELISKREAVRDGIASLLATKLTPQGIKTEAVNIVNFTFSPSFNQAIEAKVTAEQNALAAKNKLEQIKYEADQSVAKAEGEAKAIAIQAQAIQAQGGAAYIQLKALEKWDGRLPQIMGTGAMPFVNTAIESNPPANGSNQPFHLETGRSQ
jgi:regulator of protease activity HflC (stomatin/prohibitin superfamily)